MFLTVQLPPERSVAAQAIAGDANQLHRELASFGVLLLTLSCLSPVLSIYAVGSDVLVHAGTGAAGVFIGGIEMLAVLLLIGAGLWHPARSLTEVVLHPVTLSAAGTLGPVSIGAMALAGVNAAYATAGGNQAIAFGEEMREPHRHMGRVIVLAGLIGALATAVPVIAVVLGAIDLPAIQKSPAPFSAFFAAAAGTTAGHVLSAAVIVAIFNALIAEILFLARLFFSLGRDEIFHPTVNALLAKVHRSSGAPRAATWAVGVISAACCLLDTHLLVVFVSGLTVYSLALVSMAVFVGRRRRLTGQPGYWRSSLYPLAPILGLILAVGFGVADLLDADAGRPSLLVLGALIIGALAWHHFVLRKRPNGWAPRAG